MTPHVMLETTPELGIISTAAGTIADPQIRNRGTIGGSLAHGDPASDLPAVMLIGEATVTATGGDGGTRTIAAKDLFRDYLDTALEPHEVLTEIHFPVFDGWGSVVPEVQPPQRGLGDGRRLRARQADRRRLRGRPDRADEHGVDAAAGDRGRGGAQGSAAHRGDDRRRRRARRRGDAPAGRPQRQLGVQAPPGAGPHRDGRWRRPPACS